MTVLKVARKCIGERVKYQNVHWTKYIDIELLPNMISVLLNAEIAI